MLKEKVYGNLQKGLLPRGRALVVDQNPRDLASYTEVLKGMGFEVKPFTTYQEGTRCLDEQSPDFVFVSQGGATFDARGIVERALARDRHIPVVVLARNINMKCYLEAMQLGAVDYVQKPLPSAEMEYLVTTHWRPRAAENRPAS